MANPHADLIVEKEGFVVACQHGSGAGQSYGYADVLKVKPGEWFNNSQTESYEFHDSLESAQKKVEELNNYYDGSDYGS